MALVGVGMGLTMATAASAALSALPQDRSGVGAAVMQAIQKVGAPSGQRSWECAQLRLSGSVKSCGITIGSRECRARRASSGDWQWPCSLARHRCLSRCAQPSSMGWTSRLWWPPESLQQEFVLTLAFLPGRAHPKAGGIELVEVSPAHAVHADSGPGR